MNTHLAASVLRATRRHFLQRCSMGLASTFLQAQEPARAAKAKSIIFIHLAGSPSQLDLFDWKPQLAKFNGQPCPEEFLKGKRFAFIRGVPQLLASPFRFAQHGQSGMWASELLPHFPRIADRVCMVRSLHTDQFNHAPAQLLLHTGNARFGAASFGAWAGYGLGTINRDLPGFVVLCGGGNNPDAGKSLWGSGFLPSVFQGVQCQSSGDRVPYLSNPKGVPSSIRRSVLDAIKDLNEQAAVDSGDPEAATRIQQYELAFRMQMSVPEAMDLTRESEALRARYGAVPGKSSLANNCLLARRLVERGVRFVQLYQWGWDHHGSNKREDIVQDLPAKAREMDQAVTALIEDLAERSMLDSTLVVWGGEFGRTPMREVRPGAPGGFIGRDHHPFAYTMWLAGAGVKKGLNFGATDDIGYYPAENPVSVRDLQATLLHLLGLDAHKLSYPFQGLNQRLIGPLVSG
jgi:hypothetical protein